MSEDIRKGNATFLAFAHSFYKDAEAILRKKNQDYAAGNDPLSNFKLAEQMNIATTDKAIFIRMMDKVSRLSVFLQKGHFLVQNETVKDTLLDLANYCVILAYYFSQKDKIANDGLKEYIELKE